MGAVYAVEGKEQREDSEGRMWLWPPDVPLHARCNASERIHAGQLALLPKFSEHHRLDAFEKLVRVGQRRNKRGWYGCNSAVYECSVVVGDGAEGKDDAAGAAVGDAAAAGIPAIPRVAMFLGKGRH